MAAFLMASVMAVAQTDEPVISADRPGMATGTDIMPKGKVQWETGGGYEMAGGLNWVATRNLQLDVAANFNLQNPTNYLMVSGGVAWLIN